MQINVQFYSCSTVTVWCRQTGYVVKEMTFTVSSRKMYVDVSWQITVIGVPIWFPYYMKYIEEAEKVHRRATKQVKSKWFIVRTAT